MILVTLVLLSLNINISAFGSNIHSTQFIRILDKKSLKKVNQLYTFFKVTFPNSWLSDILDADDFAY